MRLREVKWLGHDHVNKQIVNPEPSTFWCPSHTPNHYLTLPKLWISPRPKIEISLCLHFFLERFSFLPLVVDWSLLSPPDFPISSDSASNPQTGLLCPWYWFLKIPGNTFFDSGGGHLWKQGHSLKSVPRDSFLSQDWAGFLLSSVMTSLCTVESLEGRVWK